MSPARIHELILLKNSFRLHVEHLARRVTLIAAAPDATVELVVYRIRLEPRHMDFWEAAHPEERGGTACVPLIEIDSGL